MESDSWSRFSATSKLHQSTLQARCVLISDADLHLGLEDFESGDDDSRAEFACPFCAEDFDIVGLCCHIDDEHSAEANNGVCPVCASRVGMDMVGHMTMQHGNFFRMQRRRRFRKGSSGSHSTLSLLKKELREGNLQTLLGGSSYAAPSPNAAADPLLSSFIYNLPIADTSRDIHPQSSDEGSVVSESSHSKVVESVAPSLSDKDQKERARRSEFVQELLLSTIFERTL